MAQIRKTEYLFETSWEVCNKVGGIHTVIGTKATELLKQFGDHLIMVGPDTTLTTDAHTEFIEDRTLFPRWVEEAAKDGFRVRTGRWNIQGKPIVILVDFTKNVPKKDSIFTELWKNFGVDSLSGQWDYVEPAIFGYTVAQVIEHFVDFNLTPRHNVLAHFHEWMTSSGILYLKNHAPWIATVFTTHATTMGRSLAGNGVPLYKEMEVLDVERYAAQFQMVAKFSLERQGAHQADAFTTVSDITANECKHLLDKSPDFVTPNGFETTIVPEEDAIKEKRKAARKRLLQVVETLYGQSIDDNALVVLISGRYEWKNKGLDVYLDAFAHLAAQKPNRQIIPLIAIPANHAGVRVDLLSALNETEKSGLPQPYVTHIIHNKEFDPISTHIEKSQLYLKDGFFPLFLPCYLNGNDGLFNMHYYDLLIGADLGVFPSYYEPWGYTPLESVAFGVPAITTSLAGFGVWIQNDVNSIADGASVIVRNDDNEGLVAEKIADDIHAFIKMSPTDVQNACKKAMQIADKLQWNSLVSSYYKAYDFAIQKAAEHKKKMRPRRQFEMPQLQSEKSNNPPKWSDMVVQSSLPDKLSILKDISQNLWWTWNYEATLLFKYMDEELWHECDKNPIVLLNRITKDRLDLLLEDAMFMESYGELSSAFQSYMGKKSDSTFTVAYLSMEYGFHDNIKIFSGGLGILAGDYLKEASDNHTNLISIGFLYRYGYFKQKLTIGGDQQAILEPHNFTDLPISLLKDEDGNPVFVVVSFPGRSVYLKVWVLMVGRNPLYLFDADNDFNTSEDRSITHQLYGGNWENRLKQEIVLGFGGYRLLKHLGQKIDVYHLNEGHAAFVNLERITALVQDEKLTFDEAIEVVRSKSLFTTHTPVPAGHDVFEEDLLRMYLRHVPERLGISWDNLMHLGRMTPRDTREPFSMSVLAANTSKEMNGVSDLHGQVSREMFQNLYKGYFANEIHISHVTNGVHYDTWTAKEWKKLHQKYFDSDFRNKLYDRDLWKRIFDVPDEEIWIVRQRLRNKLIDYIKARYEDNWIKRNDNPGRIIHVLNTIDSNTLTIGFARRFATYKRAHLIFTDIERLSKIVNNPEKPVQFVFAGKAHPADKAGQDLIKLIIEISQRPEFEGKIIFIENYDIQLAKRLVKGVDVWLNTPTRPLEASGTSGEKATMNGVLNFSVLDGWWREGYQEGAGWALQEERVYENQDFQNELDAVNIYSVLENEIVPMFYRRNEQNIPVEWVQFVKNNIAYVAPEFTTHRMLDDYIERFYKSLKQDGEIMSADNYKLATEIADWKHNIFSYWDEIEVVNIDFPDTTKHDYRSGSNYHGEVVIQMKHIDPNDIGIDLVLSEEIGLEKKAVDVFPLSFERAADNMYFYTLDMELDAPGTFEYGLRIYPKNEKFKYRTEINLVRWI